MQKEDAVSACNVILLCCVYKRGSLRFPFLGLLHIPCHVCHPASASPTIILFTLLPSPQMAASSTMLAAYTSTGLLVLLLRAWQYTQPRWRTSYLYNNFFFSNPYICIHLPTL